LEVIVRNFVRDLYTTTFLKTGPPEKIKGTHQWLVVIKHEEKIHQRPVFARLGGREAVWGCVLPSLELDA